MSKAMADDPSSLARILLGNTMDDDVDGYTPCDALKQFSFEQLSSQMENDIKNLNISGKNYKWKQVYIIRFGAKDDNRLVKKMKKEDAAPIYWKQIYEEKSKEEGPSNPPVNKANRKKSKKGFKKAFKQLKKLPEKILVGIGKAMDVVVRTVSLIVFTVLYGVVVILLGLGTVIVAPYLCWVNFMKTR